MSVRKFLAPHIVTLIVLSVFWLAGVESILQNNDEHQKNLKKYIQTQRQVVENYVDEVDVQNLYENSIRGLVANLSDSTAKLEGTPLDTTFKDLNVPDVETSVRKFEEAYLYMAQNFDDDMTKRTEDALEEMFRGLDPHSVYITPETSNQVEEEFAGKFQGIGIQFNVIDDTITVITAISGGPSEQLGIRSGDRIIEINDSSAIGFTNRDVVNSLKGPKGTKVDVTIKRPHVKELIDFTITRDDIPIYTIDASYMLDEQTGYIKINRFAATTHEEFMEAMYQLKQKGMERLVLDLRNNPGGYYGQAIAISEEFFPKNTKIVSTESRHQRFTSTIYSRRDGFFKEEPIIVLVNEGSASASEIVSGAIQDHDRGLIVGQRTFGKGLVQQQYELIDSSNIRVTISKYLTPSGRLIQKPYSKKGGEEYAYEIYQRSNDARGDVTEFVNHIPDSLRYETDAGRTVYGGGGIVPDQIVQEDTTQSALAVNYMRRNQIGFEFVRDYLDNNGDAFRKEWEDDYERFRHEFEWTDEDMQDVFHRLEERNMVVTDTVDAPKFRSDSLFVPEGHFEEVEWMSRGIMKAELARQVWGLKKYYPIINDIFDNTLDEAMTMWGEVQALKEYAMTHTRSDNY